MGKIERGDEKCRILIKRKGEGRKGRGKSEGSRERERYQEKRGAIC